MAELATGKDAWVGGSSYARQRPEQTLLYQLVEQYYPAFVAQLAAQDRTLDWSPYAARLPSAT